MPTMDTLFLVAFAGLALSASPGPSMLYVLSRSIGQSRNAGLASAAGLATGGFVHVIAAAMGMSALFTYSQFAYDAVSLLGGAYLIFLGVQMLVEKPTSEREPLEKVRQESLGRIFYQGILVEVLNPKTLLFFLAFLPPFVNQDIGSVWFQMLILGLLVPLTAVPSDLIVAFSGGSIAEKLSSSRRMNLALKWLGATFLIGLGVRLFLSQQKI